MHDIAKFYVSQSFVWVSWSVSDQNSKMLDHKNRFEFGEKHTIIQY